MAKKPAGVGDNISPQLRAFVERVENVNGEIAALSEDRKEIFAEAKGQGFDPKILRRVISIRKQDAEKRAEEEAVLETYLHALGML
jgi:uncharacterized protein (UPF0335 family)